MRRQESRFTRRGLNIEIVYNLHSSIIGIAAALIDRKGGNEEGRKINIFLLRQAIHTKVQSWAGLEMKISDFKLLRQFCLFIRQNFAKVALDMQRWITMWFLSSRQTLSLVRKVEGIYQM